MPTRPRENRSTDRTATVRERNIRTFSRLAGFVIPVRLTQPKNLLNFDSMKQTLATILTAFLLAASVQAQDLPDGAGKDLVEKVCTVCHDAARIISKKWTKEEWNTLIDKMAARGAMASDEEFEIIVTYLAKNFGKD